MVCDTCEKKLGKLVVPDKWKQGARNVVGGKDGGTRVAPAGPSSNLAEARRARREQAAPIAKQCRICKSKVAMGYNYCNDCAYKKGICTMCGRKILDTKAFKMTLK